MVVVGLVSYGGMVVRAEEPTSLLTATKAVVDYLDPTPELGVFATFKDVGDGEANWEGFAGVSGSIYKFTSHDIELGSVRLGGVFEGDRRLYTALQINGVGLAKRYLPEHLKETLSPGFMETVWDGLYKYGNLGGGIGVDSAQDLFADNYTLNDHLGVVLTAGVSISF